MKGARKPPLSGRPTLAPDVGEARQPQRMKEELSGFPGGGPE